MASKDTRQHAHRAALVKSVGEPRGYMKAFDQMGGNMHEGRTDYHQMVRELKDPQHSTAARNKDTKASDDQMGGNMAVSTETAREAIDAEARKSAASEKASEQQIGGDHYKDMQMQPDEFCYINKIPFHEGAIIKYACRWRKKGGLSDLDKIIHFVRLLKERSEAHDK